MRCTEKERRRGPHLRLEAWPKWSEEELEALQRRSAQIGKQQGVNLL
jgi:hypothetical protein